MDKVTPLPLRLKVNRPGDRAAWSQESQEILHMLGNVFGALMSAKIQSGQHALMALDLMAIHAEDKGQSRQAGAIGLIADGLLDWLAQPAPPDESLKKSVRRQRPKQGKKITAVKPKK